MFKCLFVDFVLISSRLKRLNMEFLYIHGYGSNQSSRKFSDLKEFISDCNFTCLEWNENSDFASLLQEEEKRFEQVENLIIMGDSAGANYAYQLREKRKQKGIKSILILTSPLLNLEDRMRTDFLFTDNLKNSFVKIPTVDNAFILKAREDEVLSFESFDSKNSVNSVIMQIEDTHRLER